MIIGRVVGTVVATRKDERLVGFKLLIVRPEEVARGSVGDELVAVDTVGAGSGDLVLVVKGSQAARTLGNGPFEGPVDAAIVGIVDTVEVFG